MRGQDYKTNNKEEKKKWWRGMLHTEKLVYVQYVSEFTSCLKWKVGFKAVSYNIYLRVSAWESLLRNYINE